MSLSKKSKSSSGCTEDDNLSETGQIGEQLSEMDLESDSSIQSDSSSASSSPMFDDCSRKVKLTQLPGDVLLKCASTQSERLKCRRICIALRDTIAKQSLDWELGPGTTDQTLHALTSVFPKLTSVTINRGGGISSACEGVGGDGVAALGRLRNLRKLELHFLTGLKSDDLSRLAEGHLSFYYLGSIVFKMLRSVRHSTAFARQRSSGASPLHE